MKTYVKPRLTAYSLAGNEMLCTGCGNKLSQNIGEAETILEFSGAGYGDDGVASKDDFDNVFGVGESCRFEWCEYCKTSATGPEFRIIWS